MEFSVIYAQGSTKLLHFLLLCYVYNLPGPVEEAYAIMQKFNVQVNPEEMNKVDTLRYSWDKLLSQANVVSRQTGLLRSLSWSMVGCQNH